MEHLGNGHDVPWISNDSQHRTICPTLDSASGSVDGVDATRTFGNIDRYSAFQRTRVVTDTPLQGLPRRVATCRLSIRLHDEAPTPRSTTGEPASPPETRRGATSRSARRSHRLSRPVHVMSEEVGEIPLLTVQNPADMVGATVIDCRPSGLPVSIPLSALSPGTLENARGTSGFNPSRKITISRIVGFPWNDPGTDVEDELPTPASPAQCTTPAVMPVEPGDPQELGEILTWIWLKCCWMFRSCRR